MEDSYGRELIPQHTVISLATTIAVAVTILVDLMLVRAWQICDTKSLAIIVGRRTTSSPTNNKHFLQGMDHFEGYVRAQQRSEDSRSRDITLWHEHK